MKNIKSIIKLVSGILLLSFVPIWGTCQTKSDVPLPVVFEGKQSIQQLGTDLRHIVNSKKVLVVYYSRTGYTEAAAQWIHGQVGGDLLRLETVQPYPGNYQEMVAKNVEEQRTKAMPPLKIFSNDLSNYDVVFVGFPIWAMDLPRPMATFLSSNDFSKKTIIPFCTNGGYGPGASQSTIENLCPKSKILDILAFRGNRVRENLN